MLERKNIPVYTTELATALMNDGFECVDTVPNYKFEGKSVFFFENTQQVHDFISNFSLKKGRDIFKVKNRKVANKLIEKGYEQLDINQNKTDGVVYIFKWTDTIYEDNKKIRKELFEK